MSMSFPTRSDQLRRVGVQAVNRGRSIARTSAALVRGRLVERRLDPTYAPQPDDAFVVAAYFAGDAASLYQLREWLLPFERLSERLVEEGHGEAPLAIFCRNADHARRITPATQLPIRFGRLAKDLEAFMGQSSLRVVFYVNQATMNFQSLRFTRPAHVHLSHGESEKVSMISNQLKAYDYIFTAGQAARQRLLGTLVGFREQGGEARMIDIGRPQLDAPRQAPQAWREMTDSERLTVFYAPTWEGDSPSMAYGTLKHNGPAIVRGLLEAGCRVIFRPHPRTGVIDVETAQALAAVKQLVIEHPRGYLDDDVRLGWQFDAADACLAEMSAVAFDWLSTGKPLVLIRPDDPGAEVLPGGLLDRAPAGDARQPSEIVDLVTATAGSSDSGAARDAQAYYLGNTEPGQQQLRFEAATIQIVGERSAE